MKNLIILCISTLLFASLVQGQDSNKAAYAKYSTTKKEVSVLEWKLIQVNLKLGEKGYFVYFDDQLSLFKVDIFKRFTLLKNEPPSELRELLLSECHFAAAVIGSEFPEFRRGVKKDLTITYMIGEASSRTFAIFSSGSLSFTDDYYSFRKEHGL